MEFLSIIINGNTFNTDKLIHCLDNGGLIVYPTDTIYGIAASINSQTAIENVFKVKKRDYDKPLSICVNNKSQIGFYCDTTPIIDKIIDKVLPGAYTLLLKKKTNLSNLLTSDNDTVAIRIPDNIICSKLTQRFPITSTSANISGRPVKSTITDIKRELGDSIDYYIDDGIIDQQASTIIDLTSRYPELVRKSSREDELVDKILKIRLY